MVKKSLSFVQVGEAYRLTKATNTVVYKMGKMFTKAELEAIIGSGIVVTITNNK